MNKLDCHVRPAAAPDEQDWRLMWQAYCDYYNIKFPISVEDTLWARIMTGDAPVNALIAEIRPHKSDKKQIVGFANYILHPYTWGTEPVCYLEDLFVIRQARRKGVGGALISSLVDLCRQNGWPRLYWHTHVDNAPARALYERFVPVDPFVRYLIRIS